MSTNLIDRVFTRPERNVGHTDFATRVMAVLILGGLVALLMPVAGVPHSMAKICLLTAAELGVVSLMLGLFLRGAKTYFAGLQLIAAAFLMTWLESRGLRYAAVVVGLGFLVIGVINLITRRSRLNQVLNFSSIRTVITEMAPLPTTGDKK